MKLIFGTISNALLCTNQITIDIMCSRFAIVAILTVFIVTGCTKETSSVDTASVLAASPAEASPNYEVATPKPEPNTPAVKDEKLSPVERLPEDMVEIINKRMEAVLQPVNDDAVSVVGGYRTIGLDNEKDAKIAELLRKAKDETDIKSPVAITHEHISKEVDYLFDMLKYGYSLYTYWGGDEVFDALKHLIIAKLSTMSDPLSIGDYQNNLLIPCLRPVIIDNHFAIGNATIGSGKKSFYMNDDLIFTKSGDVYVTIVNGKRYRVPVELEPLLKPTLTKNGELAWTAGGMLEFSNNTTLSGVMLENAATNEIERLVLPFTAVSEEYTSNLNDDIYAIRIESGIPILSNRSLDPWDQDATNKLNEFVETGTEMRTEPLLIPMLTKCFHYLFLFLSKN